MLFTEEKNAVYRFIAAIIKEYKYCKKTIKNILTKTLSWLNLIIKDVLFKKLVSAWYVISYLLTNNEVRDHDLMAGKYGSSAHKKCKINLSLTKEFIIIFHKVRDYDSHLIMQKLSTFDVKIDVMPNGLEKYIDFVVNKNSDFVDSIQFMNSSLDVLVKNLSDNDF